MNLEQLKEQASKDLIIENEEHLDSESLKNQKIKAKYLEHKTRYQLLLQKSNGDYQRMYRENGSTTVVRLMLKFMLQNHLI